MSQEIIQHITARLDSIRFFTSEKHLSEVVSIYLDLFGITEKQEYIDYFLAEVKRDENVSKPLTKEMYDVIMTNRPLPDPLPIPT